MRSSLVAGLAIAAVVLGSVLPARAATVLAATLEEMTVRAPIVVRAQVVRQQYFVPDGSKRVYTDTELRITETLKGAIDGIIVVRQPGGVFDGHLVEVEGAARFAEGEDILLFVAPATRAPGVFIPLALSASKVSFLQKPHGLRAIRRLDGLAFVTPGPSSEAVRPLGGEEDLGSAEDLLEKVRVWSRRESR